MTPTPGSRDQSSRADGRSCPHERLRTQCEWSSGLPPSCRKQTARCKQGKLSAWLLWFSSCPQLFLERNMWPSRACLRETKRILKTASKSAALYSKLSVLSDTESEAKFKARERLGRKRIALPPGSSFRWTRAERENWELTGWEARPGPQSTIYTVWNLL